MLGSVYILWFSFLLVTLADGEIQCGGIEPYRRVNTSAAGKWHLIRGIKIGGTNESRNACGFFNTVQPCKCIGAKISPSPSPFSIQNYNMINFGYNSALHSYSSTDIKLSLVSNKSIYNAYVPLAKINFTIAVVGTDDFASWMSLVMCEDLRDRSGNVGKLMWVITRSPQPSRNIVQHASNSLKKYINKTKLPIIDIDQTNCPPLF